MHLAVSNSGHPPLPLQSKWWLRPLSHHGANCKCSCMYWSIFAMDNSGRVLFTFFVSGPKSWPILIENFWIFSSSRRTAKAVLPLIPDSNLILYKSCPSIFYQFFPDATQQAKQPFKSYWWIDLKISWLDWYYSFLFL